MGWDGMGWDGMGWDGMGWDGMGWDGMGWDGMGWVKPPFVGSVTQNQPDILSSNAFVNADVCQIVVNYSVNVYMYKADIHIANIGLVDVSTYLF